MGSIKHAKHAKPALHPTRSTLSAGLTAALLPLCLASPALADTSTTAATSTVTTSALAVAKKPTSMRISGPAGAVAPGSHLIGVRLLSEGQYVPGEEVDVQKHTASGWVALGRMRTDAQGLAKQPFSFAATTKVRAVYAGSVTKAASVSPEQLVTIAKQTTSMRISGPAGYVNAGDHAIGVRLLADGRYVPSAYVRVERATAAGWEYLGRMVTDANGLAKQSFRFAATTRVRAVYEGSATRKASVSPVQTVSIGTFRTRAVQVAAAQQGKPYQYGAVGPNSFDCSGLVKYAFAQVGKALPRTSQEMRNATPGVAKTAKIPGDLVFIHSSTGRVTHVGVYAGNESIWVAPKAGDVVKYQRIYTSSYSVGRVS